MDFLKKHYNKILMVLFCVIFLNCCMKNCTKSNEIRTMQTQLDSCIHNNTKYHDSIIYLNNIINHKNVEIDSKNEQINQLNRTINTVINKNSINHIRVIVPEQEKNVKTDEQ